MSKRTRPYDPRRRRRRARWALARDWLAIVDFFRLDRVPHESLRRLVAGQVGLADGRIPAFLRRLERDAFARGDLHPFGPSDFDPPGGCR